MAATVYKMNVTSGEDTELVLVWKNGDHSAIDVTGFSFDLFIYKDSGTDLFANLNVGNGGMEVFPTLGKIRLIFPASLTQDVQLTPYANYKLWMVTPNMQQKLFMKGLFTLVEP